MSEIDRESLGRLVRETWVAWAEGLDSPKDHWLQPWDELVEGMKEVDRLIGVAVAKRVMESGYVSLGSLRPGAVFENADGVRAVKSEYHYTSDPGCQCQCVLLESGEYAHFRGSNDEPVRELLVIES